MWLTSMQMKAQLLLAVRNHRLPPYHAAIKGARRWGGDPSSVVMACLRGAHVSAVAARTLCLHNQGALKAGEGHTQT